MLVNTYSGGLKCIYCFSFKGLISSSWLSYLYAAMMVFIFLQYLRTLRLAELYSIPSTQIKKSHQEEHRRASSYHSFSQSPPNDYQYEERRNRKQPAMLSRKPSSDRGHDGKMPGFSYRSHSLQERMSEDQFANESRGPRTSDCSGSSMSGTFGTAPKSPDFFDDGCLSPPVQQNQSNMLSSNGTTQSQVIDFEIYPLSFLVASHKIA